MILENINIQGFRNFKNTEINLTEKSLVIGSNEIGKSNLLYALRLLLDKTIPQSDLSPNDADFYAYEVTNEIKITLKFTNITEDCILSKMKEHVSENGEMFLRYSAVRDERTRRITFNYAVGKDLESLDDIETTRYYLKVLNLKFIGTNRDLFHFIRRERRNLLQDAKEIRTDEEQAADISKLEEIKSELDQVHEGISSLSFVNRATERLNSELKELSSLNENQNVIFDTGASDPSRFIDNLNLATEIDEKKFLVGGDGRNNQIHLALWAARNRPVFESDEEPLEVNIFCIEEPEAHLHPHQQRKLARYLSDNLQAQVIITTHSPQIVTAFPPETIIRLYDNKPDTLAAGNGSNPFIRDAIIDFSFRMNIIPAETFFSNGVLLVEGPSEELFYKALAKAINIDLDRENISILAVNGVGFLTYASLLSSLKIDFVLRTDNDIFKIQGSEEYRYAGIQRGLAIYRDVKDSDKTLDALLNEHEITIQSFEREKPPEDIAKLIIKALENTNIFIANVDLEKDLSESELKTTLAKYLNTKDDDKIIRLMKAKKATFMFNFIHMHTDSLEILHDNRISQPLKRCIEITTSNADN
ncbi:MAG: AAA family ATPase [Chloroflexi bacterium]|nr:AAA family ATPase [Chloroflexota bacterium]